MKKIISIVFSLLILIPTISYAKSINIQNSMNVYTESIPYAVTTFVSDNLTLFLETVKENPSMYRIDENIVDSLYVGNGFNSFEYKNNVLENNNIYFFPLLYNKELKAVLTVGYDGENIVGATLSSSLSEKLDKMQKSKITKKPYIFIKNKDSFIAKTEDCSVDIGLKLKNSSNIDTNYSYLANDVINKINGTNIKVTNISDKDDNIIINHNEKSTLSTNSLSLLSSYPTNKFLSVPCVSQKIGTTMYNMCWAAVVASITNFRTGSSLTAPQVCNDANIGYNDGGNTMNSKVAYLRYNIYTTNIAGVIGEQEIIANICANKPIDMGLYTADSTYAHAVALRGYGVSGSGMALSIMNPWTNRYETMYRNSTNTSPYTLYMDGHTFEWDTTITLD